MRRVLILLALLLASGITLAAQQRAMILLNSGERLSATVSRTAPRWLNRSANLLVDVNNEQRQLSMSDIAVIDFDVSGARPSTRELNSLRSDGSHALVMRNGRLIEG